MVPLRDQNPTKITPYVTYVLIGLNIAIFLYEISLSPQQLDIFFKLYAVVPAELTASFRGITVNQPVPEWLTLFTAQFLHGGILHLGGNMLYLWVFGDNIEEVLGRIRYVIFYLLCGVLASLAQWFFSSQSGVPSLGASGAIAGIMGAYVLRFYDREILTLLPIFIIWTTIRVPAIFFIGFWFIQQAFYGVASLNTSASIGMEGGGVAYWAHAGGFVFGAILAPILGLFDNNQDTYY
ncbi:Rhomboid family protein [Halothece sp. PCC 7418]|uniref:rhomboid family intramembrane serine protease n=1 Tax=Halothece sp. (strain PCC 7418) TaxID=65093 RepID=UPI0002A05B9F|nr:rhomboid family intramembrane serine protease [Halothece sp. PCC 7418]AFZ44429.1 Rhomboid family protein [Halothece sp. PCC 7418]